MRKGSVRNGIMAGGNWIVDRVKMIDVYPREERLANITGESTGNGGAPYNILKALFKLNVPFPLEGVGLLGDDETGDEVLADCQSMNINVAQVRKVQNVRTSYTDVMTVAPTGKRTFFHYRGANALLDRSHFDFSSPRAKIFHLGYLLLLDKLDEIGPDGFTGAAKVLEEARQAGIITTADIVSEQSDRYKTIIPSSLPFIDILFINEFEAKMLTGIEIADTAGSFSYSNARKAAETILAMGVQKWVIIHFQNGAVALNRRGRPIFRSGIDLPSEKIKGTVGAGDAFAAGVLLGLHDEWPMEESLEMGVNVAAASLTEETSSGGIRSQAECLEMKKIFGYKN